MQFSGDCGQSAGQITVVVGDCGATLVRKRACVARVSLLVAPVAPVLPDGTVVGHVPLTVARVALGL